MKKKNKEVWLKDIDRLMACLIGVKNALQKEENIAKLEDSVDFLIASVDIRMLGLKLEDAFIEKQPQ